MALDSDINNPDNALWVEFYEGTVLQTFLSEQEGRPIYHDVVMTRIRIPGNDTTVIDRPLEEGDKLRFPRHWAFFEAKNTDGGHPGTPISEMPGVTKAMVENMRVRGFYTVEQFAAASDSVLQNLGMNVGVSPIAFRDQCKRFLGAAADMAPTVRLEAELKQRDAQIAALEAQQQATNAMLAKLMAGAQPAAVPGAVEDMVGGEPDSALAARDLPPVAPRAPRTGAIPPKSDKAA